jgi:hypothetical protein
MGLLGSFNSIGRVLGPSMGGFAYVVSMLLPYLGSAVIALASMAIVHFRAPGSANKNILAAADSKPVASKAQ